MCKKIRIATLFSGGLAAAEFAFKYENIKHEVVLAAKLNENLSDF